MLKGIPIGCYLPGQSIIHKSDPRTKIICSIIFGISTFMLNFYVGLLIAATYISMAIVLSKVPFISTIRGLKAIALVILLTVIINMFSIGGVPVAELGWFTITREGIETSIKLAARLILLVIGSEILTLTTSPIDIANGVSELLKPLRTIKIPVEEFATMISIAIRFIPVLFEEADKVIKAQIARGVDVGKGSIIKRAKEYTYIIIPLLVAALSRADDLAIAMEARCYGISNERTNMNVLKFTKIDVLILTVTGIYFVAVVLTDII